MGVRDYLDRVLTAYSNGPYYEEVKRAKEEYFERAGRVAEGSEKFEIQMNSFLDWYLFDRPLNKSDIEPVKLFTLEHLEALEQVEKEVFLDLTKTIHSLFELLKSKDSDIYVKDLFDGEKYVITEQDINKGFSKGDIFEARLIPYKGELVFGSAFIFHPKECRSFITKQIKKIKYLDQKQRLRLLHQLAGMKLKIEQYTHIDVKHIYTETPLF